MKAIICAESQYKDISVSSLGWVYREIVAIEK